MALELIAYAAPLARGAALVAPRAALDAIGSAARVLAVRPQAARLSLLVPDGEPEIDPSDARGFFRAAATAASLSGPAASVGPSGRWHTAVVVCGWLLILGGGGSIAAGLAGLWLAVLYPLLRGALVRRRAEALSHAARGLAYALAESPLEARAHDGLTELRRVLGDGGAPAQERYRHAAAACGPLGLTPLAEFYEALARGAAPDTPWCAMSPASDETSQSAADDGAPTGPLNMEAHHGPVRQPA